MVVFSSRISPRASTSIFLDRSPWATAVVTWAMLRTWLVRLPAMKFTESVRSRQVPPTPGTCAWPPSRPSVPTSRATRVTSSANADSWSTMVFRVSFRASISPLTSTVIFWLRSPLATAVATWAMSRTWPVRLSAIALTESVRSFQVPATPGTWAWPPSLPSVPTSRATRVTSEVNRASWSVMLLNTAAISSISGSPVCGRRVLKSPPRTAVRPVQQLLQPRVGGLARPQRCLRHRPTPHVRSHDAAAAAVTVRLRQPILPRPLTWLKIGVRDTPRPVAWSIEPLRSPGKASSRVTAASGGEFARLSELIARQRRELDRTESAAAARSVVDLARGMLMERLGCSPAEAQEQLAHLSAESGTSVAELAAQITGQPSPARASTAPGTPGQPRPPARRSRRVGRLAAAAMETAPDGAGIATALLEEALAASRARPRWRCG